MKKEKEEKNEPKEKGLILTIVVLAVICLLLTGFLLFTVKELSNTKESIKECEVQKCSEDDEIKEDKKEKVPAPDKTEEKPNNDKQEEKTEEDNNVAYNSNGELTITQVNGNSEYQNYIKQLQNRKNGKTIMIYDEYEDYIATEYILGIDNKLYVNYDDNNKNKTFIRMSDTEVDENHVGAMYGAYSGINNVVDIFSGSIGNGGQEYLIILRADGKLYFVNINKGKNLELKEIDNLNNIVSVYFTEVLGSHTMFAVDISGRTFEVNDASL